MRYDDMPPYLPGWAVIDDLNDLRGPDYGTVHLPIELYWGAKPDFDLDQPDQRRPYLQAVLREAPDETYLARFINRTVLEHDWHRLRLPESLRRAWNNAHPSLTNELIAS
ncbi:MAG: hypothetical protein LBL92_04795 [Propionibacteriaceae bacterium]|nr:hypothetical protein [Propionibacteriaceae bacterium]